MCQLLESIYCCDGEFRNLHYHEERMRRSQLELFGKNAFLPLREYFNSLIVPPSGLFKVRLVYDTEIKKVEFIPYTAKSVRSFKHVQADKVNYDHKFLDRSELNALHDQREAADEILIVRNGFITDASYANVIFKRAGMWYTPQHYLLNGTMRQFLLDTKRIQMAVIDGENYKYYESIKLINSMLGMEGSEISVKSIL